MEVFVQLICIVVLVRYSLKAASSGSLTGLSLYAAFAAALAMMIYPWVIRQPLTIVSNLLADREMVQNIALLTTAEAIAGIFIPVYLLDHYFKPKEKRSFTSRMLKTIPGVLVFFAIAYFELLFFKYRAGGDFLVTAFLYGAILFLFTGISGCIFRYVLQSESLKLEIKVFMSLTILVGGLLISSAVADYNVSHAQTEIEWIPLIVLLAGTVALILLGVWMYQTDFGKKLKRQLKWIK